ncbi:hypothetical protein ACFFSY_07580 [Paenibacillus aurantiacus]|uniref:Uncharacterized protein n=1 Tax=Paenibacillus aurantiacus TaxID=1936118 RepID=A0ABV5KLJ6_9BACL
MADKADSYIEAEVIAPPSVLETNVWGIQAYHVITVEVLKRIEGEVVPAKIELIISARVEGADPMLRQGMRVIAGVAKAGEDAGRLAGKYFVSRYSTFYVTDSGYVLSVAGDDYAEEVNGRRAEWFRGWLRGLTLRRNEA